MLKNIKIYITSIIIIVGISSSAIGVTLEDKIILLDRINQIRTAPFSYALALGYDTAFLEKRGISPYASFKPYEMDENLNAEATDNSNFMGQENSEPSYLVTAETGGIVSFKNFMPINIAGKIIIDNLFRQELENANFQYILSRKYSYAGIAMKSGMTETFMNAWFLTLRFGSSVMISEIQLLNMINQVRAEPWTILEILDISIVDLLNQDKDLLYLFMDEYPPVFMNDALHTAAQAKVVSNLDAQQTGMSVLERSVYYGYTGQSVRESLDAVIYEKDNLISGVSEMFSVLLWRDFDRWSENSVVFSNGCQDAGLGISLTPGQDIDIALFSLIVGSDNNDEATPDEEIQTSKIYGVLFLDDDENNLYSPGEEIVGNEITIYNADMEPVKMVATDSAGHFSLTLNTNGIYFFKAGNDDFLITQEIYLSDDKFVKLAVSPPSL